MPQHLLDMKFFHERVGKFEKPEKREYFTETHYVLLFAKRVYPELVNF